MRVLCCCCGAYKDNNECVAVVEFEHVIHICHSCAGLSVFRCSHCQEVKTLHERVLCNNTNICIKCYSENYSRCRHCSGDFLQSSLINVSTQGEDSWVCNNCHERNYRVCTVCNTLMHRNYIIRDDPCTCRECFGLTQSQIHSYDFKPRARFFGDIPGKFTTNPIHKLYCGIELEIEKKEYDHELDREDNHGIMLDYIAGNKHKDYFYVKHDGSLENGIEIVSQPATPEWIYKHFDNYWGRILKKAAEYGYCSWTSGRCGIHIHMSKKAFTTLQIFKILRFNLINSRFLEMFSGRSSSSFGRWAKIQSNRNTKTSWKKMAKSKYFEDKYTAFNLCNDSTCEWRIFRGSLKPKRLLLDLDFCMAVYAFTNKYNIEDSCRLDLFVKFVQQNNYKMLSEYIAGNKEEIEKLYDYAMPAESVIGMPESSRYWPYRTAERYSPLQNPQPGEIMEILNPYDTGPQSTTYSTPFSTATALERVTSRFGEINTGEWVAVNAERIRRWLSDE